MMSSDALMDLLVLVGIVVVIVLLLWSVRR